MKKFLSILALMPCISFAGNGISISNAPGCTLQQAINQMVNSNYVLKTASSSTLYGVYFYYEPKTTNTNIINLLSSLESSFTSNSSTYSQDYNATYNAILSDLAAQPCARIINIIMPNTVNLDNFETGGGASYPSYYYQTQQVREAINFPASRVNDGAFHPTNPAAISWEGAGGTYAQKPGFENPYQFATNSDLIFTKMGAFTPDTFPSNAQNRDFYTINEQQFHRTDMTNAAEQLTGTNWFSAKPDKYSIYGETFARDIRDVQKTPQYQQYVPNDSTGKKWLPTSSAQQAPKHQNDPNNLKSEDRRQMKELFRNGDALPVQSVSNRIGAPKFRGQPYTDDENYKWNNYQSKDDENEIIDVGAYGDYPGDDYEYTQCARPGEPITVDLAVHWKDTANPWLTYNGGSGAAYIIGTAIGDLRTQFPSLTNKQMRDYIMDATKQKSGRIQKDPCTGWGDYDHQYVMNYISARINGLYYSVRQEFICNTAAFGHGNDPAYTVQFFPMVQGMNRCNLYLNGVYNAQGTPTYSVCPYPGSAYVDPTISGLDPNYAGLCHRPGGCPVNTSPNAKGECILNYSSLNYYYPSKTRYPDASGNNALDSPSAACNVSGGVIINPFANGLGSNSYECIMTNGSYVTTGFESCWVGDQYIGGGKCYRQAGCPAGKTASSPDYICK